MAEVRGEKIFIYDVRIDGFRELTCEDVNKMEEVVKIYGRFRQIGKDFIDVMADMQDMHERFKNG